MQLCHTARATSAVFDDPNLVSSAGLLPVLALARSAGLQELAQQHLSVPTDKGANAGLKVTSLVAGMVAGADSIDDMALLRHGGMGRGFVNAYAPSTLGSFLRAFSFGHVRQLDAVASRFLARLDAQAPPGFAPGWGRPGGLPRTSREKSCRANAGDSGPMAGTRGVSYWSGSVVVTKAWKTFSSSCPWMVSHTPGHSRCRNLAHFGWPGRIVRSGLVARSIWPRTAGPSMKVWERRQRRRPCGGRCPFCSWH
jgi:hypothetical protein